MLADCEATMAVNMVGQRHSAGERKGSPADPQTGQHTPTLQLAHCTHTLSHRETSNADQLWNSGLGELDAATCKARPRTKPLAVL